MSVHKSTVLQDNLTREVIKSYCTVQQVADACRCGSGSSILGQCGSESESGSGSRVLVTKNCKIFTEENKNINHWASIKDVQVTGEPSALKREHPEL
jgi:hypothetical protein